MTRKTDAYDDTPTDQAAPDPEETCRVRTRWQVLPQWRDTNGRHYTDPDRWHTDHHAACADFHTATRELNADRLGYTVELIRTEAVRDGNGRWRTQGAARTVDRWPGGMAVATVRPNLRAIAARFKMPAELADPCTGCGQPATSYDPDGQAWCAGHLPRAAGA